MGQVSRPASDISTGGWTPTPIYPIVNEATPDANAVASPDDTGYHLFEVRLKGLAWPADGTRKLTVRLRRQGATAASASIMLFQGATPITGTSLEPGTGFQDVVLALTVNEAALITDYTDLRVKVAANKVVTACCPAGLDGVLKGKFTNKTGVFAKLPDEEVPFVHTGPGSQTWQWNAKGLLARDGDLEIQCVGTACGGLRLFSGAGIMGPVGQAPDASPPCSCSPLFLSYTVSGAFPAGMGGYTLTLTE